MSVLLIQYQKFSEQGFDQLGAIVMVIDGYPERERFEPTTELLEEIGYQRTDNIDVQPEEFCVKTVSGRADESALPSFFVNFRIGRLLIQYQPLNRFILRGKSCLPHRPESDFCFADWYPISQARETKRKSKVEDQIADEFPNAAMAAQFLHDEGFKRSNTHKKIGPNTYFVSARHGDGQPSGVVFRGDGETFFYDFYADERYVIGASGLLKEHRPTQRQLDAALSLVAMNLPQIP